jgi:hypothetical protein
MEMASTSEKKQPVPKRRLRHAKESRIDDGEEQASNERWRGASLCQEHQAKGQSVHTEKYTRPRKSTDIKKRTRSQRKGRSPREWYASNASTYDKGNKKTQSDDVETGRNDLGKQQPAVLATFEGLGSEDFSIESSSLA